MHIRKSNGMGEIIEASYAVPQNPVMNGLDRAAPQAFGLIGSVQVSALTNPTGIPQITTGDDLTAPTMGLNPYVNLCRGGK